MMEPMPEDWERAVAVVAHPDDLEYGAAAAVARWTGQGQHVAYGLATLDACRDAANSWLFPDAGPAWNGIKAIYVAASGNPTHFVDTTGTIEAGIASLREHKAYLDGLGRDFDPDEFLRNMAGFIGL